MTDPFEILNTEYCFVCDGECIADAYSTDHDMPSIEDLEGIEEYV